MNRINAAPPIRFDAGFRPGNDEDVLIFRRVFVNVRNLLVNITFHATAPWRVKLSQIADLQEICELQFAICDFVRVAVFFDDAVIATSSPASAKSG